MLRLPLGVVSGDYSLVAVHGLHIVVASLVAEHILEHAGPVTVACWLSCPEACRVFPDGMEPMSPALAGGFLATGPPEKSQVLGS